MIHNFCRYGLLPVLLLSLCFPLLFPFSSWSAPAAAYADRKAPLPILGDYAGELREPHPRQDGIRHVDTVRTIRKLKELGVNSYLYLVWHAPTDWDDLRREFLPAAQKAGIDVWVYLVPPSEARSKSSEPFGTDYIAWFRAIGRLSQSYGNLKGVVMDDFNHNYSFFSPEYVAKMRSAGRKMNPELKFYPQIYYTGIKPDLIKPYRSLIDGVIMTYRDGKYRNTQRTRELDEQIEQAAGILRKEQLPLVLMVHASKLSATPSNPSVRYIQTSMRIGLDHMRKGNLQGLITYVLQKEWFPERKDRSAHSGFGYGSLFVPPGNHPSPGGWGEWQQPIVPDGSGKYTLDFYHLSVYPWRLRNGQYVKQVLIDGQVVWERDVHQDLTQRWKRAHIHLTPHLKGKKEAVLSLRLYRKQKGPTSWFYTGFDQLQPTGFQLANPGFEKPEGWTYRSNHPAVIGETLIFDPQRRLRVYLTTMMMYTLYRFQHEVNNSGNPAIKKETGQLFTAIVEGRNQQALHRLNLLLERLNDHTSLDQDQRQQLQKMGKKLDHLLSVNP